MVHRARVCIDDKRGLVYSQSKVGCDAQEASDEGYSKWTARYDLVATHTACGTQTHRSICGADQQREVENSWSNLDEWDRVPEEAD